MTQATRGKVVQMLNFRFSQTSRLSFLPKPRKEPSLLKSLQLSRSLLSKVKRTHKSKHTNMNSSLVKVHVGHRRHVPFTRCSPQGGQLQLGGLVRSAPPLRVSATCFAHGEVGWEDLEGGSTPVGGTTPATPAPPAPPTT